MKRGKNILKWKKFLVWEEAAVIPLYHYSKNVMARPHLLKPRVNYQGFLDLTALAPLSGL
jgi:hypothetical protein